MRPVVRLCVRACAVAAVLLLTVFASAIARAQQPHEIAMQYFQAGRYHEALTIYQRLAEQHRRSGDATKYAASIIMLGMTYSELGRLAEAERFLKESLALQGALRARETDRLERLGNTYNALATIYYRQRRLSDAESHYRQSLSLMERCCGADHPETAKALGNIASVYMDQGRFEEATKVLLRALAIQEARLGDAHPEVVPTLQKLALIMGKAGKIDQAEKTYMRCLAILERSQRASSDLYAAMLNNLALLYDTNGRHAQAEPLYRRSLELRRQIFGPLHAETAQSLHNLAIVLANLGRDDEAERLYKEALATWEQAVGPDHPSVALALKNLGVLALNRKRWLEGYNYVRRAYAIHTARALSSTVDDRVLETDPGKPREVYFEMVSSSWHLSVAEPSRRGDLVAEAFEAVQRLDLQTTGKALAQVGVRFAVGNSALASRVRARQDLVEKHQNLDRALILAMSPSQGRLDKRAVEKLRAELADTGRTLAEMTASIEREFPQFADLMRPKPLPLQEARKLLTADEAMLVVAPTRDELYLWIVTRDAVEWQLVPISWDELDKRVRALRCGLDASAWLDESAGKPCTQLVGGASYTADDARNGRLPPFDGDQAFQLYKDILAPFEKSLKTSSWLGASSWKRLLVVASGPLTSLPMGVLLTEKPAQAALTKTDGLRKAQWLGTRQAITVLPTPASLKTLRQQAGTSGATRPFIGFGNPLLEGDPKDAGHAMRAKMARAAQRCADAVSVAALDAARGRALRSGSGGVADAGQLRAQLPLPETAKELCDVARNLGMPDSEIDAAIRLGARATEAEIKGLSSSGQLASYRILHFATHGALSGEISGSDEPGLILSPPRNVSDADDGYLTASEIAQLRIDADWVILSACNTAGGSDSETRTLSGLARAFFYAGARAILVSHWAVDSDATVKLITTAFAKLKADAKLNRAEAVRLAMVDLISSGTSNEAHPTYWAPFVMVGEGTR
jgi:CHAT domain-containing protein/Flp pilus assembly protein TadD